MDAAGTVTASEVTKKKSGKETMHDASIYVECTLCRDIDHMLRVSYYWERDEKGQLGLEDVDFSFPSELFVKEPWRRVKRWPWRFFQLAAEPFRRLKLSLLVLFGRPIYFCPGTSLSLDAARQLGQKMITMSTNALQDHGTKGKS